MVGGAGGRSLLGPLAAAIVAVLLALAQAESLGPVPRMWCSFLLVLVLPGAAVSLLRLGGGLDLWERIALSFLGSLMVLVAAGLLCLAAGWGLRQLAWLIPAATILIALPATLARRRPGESTEGASGGSGARSSRAAHFLVAALLLLAVALSSNLSGEMGASTDSFDHLATIGEIRDTGKLTPLTAFYKHPEASLPDPRKGLFHAGLAAMSLYSGQDPVQVWVWLPGALLPLTLLIVFCLGRALTGSTAGGVVSAVFWISCFGGAGSRLPAQIGYAHNVSEIASWVLILMLIKYAGGERGRLALLSAIGLAACCFVHISAIVLALAAWGCLLVTAIVLGGRARRPLGAAIGRVGILWLALGVPAAGAKVLLSYAPANPIQLQSQNLLYLTDSLYVVNPMWICSWLGIPGIMSIALALWPAFRTGGLPGRLYMVGATLLPVAVVLNPVLVPVFYSVIGYLVERFAWVVPYPYLLAFTFMAAAGRVRSGQGILGRGGAAAVALAILAAVASAGLSRVEKMSSQGISYKGWAPALEYLDKHVEEPAVVASDMLTSYSIPALTRHYIVSTLHQHGSPNDPRGLERIVALNRIMNPYSDPDLLSRTLAEHEVDYILVNKTFDGRRRLYFSEVDPAALQRLDEELACLPEVFRETFRAKGLGLYSVDRDSLGALGRWSRPRPPYVLPPGREPGGTGVNEVFEGKIELVSVELSDRAPQRGGRIDITCYWRRAVEDLELDLPWVVQVRIQRDYEKGPLYSPAYGKVYRNVLQLLRGERYRWRRPHLPAGGAFPPPMWGDSVIVDRSHIPIPRWLEPGEYEITVSIGREPVYPTFTLRDFLRDDDRYSGITAGVIEVR